MLRWWVKKKNEMQKMTLVPYFIDGTLCSFNQPNFDIISIKTKFLHRLLISERNKSSDPGPHLRNKIKFQGISFSYPISFQMSKFCEFIWWQSDNLRKPIFAQKIGKPMYPWPSTYCPHIWILFYHISLQLSKFGKILIRPSKVIKHLFR